MSDVLNINIGENEGILNIPIITEDSDILNISLSQSSDILNIELQSVAIWDDILGKPDDIVQDEAYVHTDNNFTDAEQYKLSSLTQYTDEDAKNAISEVGYLTEETEFNASVAKNIQSTDIENWNTSYSNNHTHDNKQILDNIGVIFTLTYENEKVTQKLYSNGNYIIISYNENETINQKKYYLSGAILYKTLTAQYNGDIFLGWA